MFIALSYFEYCAPEECYVSGRQMVLLPELNAVLISVRRKHIALLRSAEWSVPARYKHCTPPE